MPLKAKQRGNMWVAYGRVELDGIPITGYYHNKGTGAFTEAGAIAWLQAETTRQKRRYLLGDKAERITFVMAVLQYDAKPTDAGYLAKILTHAPELGGMAIDEITGKFIKNLGLKIYPAASTDTVTRQVVTPVRAVINNMHELGKGPYLRIKDFTTKERIDRDVSRNKASRVPKSASDKTWMDAFCASADVYNAALARFMFETAARIDQAVCIEPRDLNLKSCKVRIKAQKGHPEQWIDISHEMMIDLANLPAKCPFNRKTGQYQKPRVFGYGSRGGYHKAWKAICAKAGIKYLSAHEAGRHGFATELHIRQGVDATTVAQAGRWSSTKLVTDNYSHSETSQAEIRERFRTYPEHATSDKTTIYLIKKDK